VGGWQGGATGRPAPIGSTPQAGRPPDAIRRSVKVTQVPERPGLAPEQSKLSYACYVIANTAIGCVIGMKNGITASSAALNHPTSSDIKYGIKINIHDI
jgi:hypothetical protein